MSNSIPQPRYEYKDAVDFVIVGAGAAGGVLAIGALARKGEIPHAAVFQAG
jgi:alkyl hydroperoxide reductase subunit AhpF